MLVKLLIYIMETAKFYNGNIITSSQYATLMLLDIQVNILQNYDVNTNWIDSVEDDNIVIYGNFNHEVGIIRMDDDNNIIDNKIVMVSENLQIDPTITKINDTYYITATEIIGNINNSDPEVENGKYIIHLYKTDDLENLELVSNIQTDNCNLEDVDVIYENNIIYVVYEKEDYDKGNSAIVLTKSTDLGNSWDTPIVLLENNCDHEPTSFIHNKNEWILYYSCDKENLGESYMGANVYYSCYDDNFNVIKKDVKVSTESKTGILLYDISEIDGHNYLLYTRNYYTDSDLVIEKYN
ncbi:MAG: hypothetical protein PHG16_12260 [Lachnospiraceae bacterium]|nr:hypothetical protein [Lachnospiraceae bacterium]